MKNPAYISTKLKSAEITVTTNPENSKEYYFEDMEILRIIKQFIRPNLEVKNATLKKKYRKRREQFYSGRLLKIFFNTALN